MLLVTMLPSGLTNNVAAATPTPATQTPTTATQTPVPQTPAATQTPNPNGPPDTSAFTNVWNRTDALVASSSVKRTWFWGPKAVWTTREIYVDHPTGTQ